MAGGLDRLASAIKEHVIEVRIKARFGEEECRHLCPRLDRPLFDDRQAITGKSDWGMARVRKQNHVVDSERGKDLRTGAIPAHCVAELNRFARTDVDRARER